MSPGSFEPLEEERIETVPRWRTSNNGTTSTAGIRPSASVFIVSSSHSAHLFSSLSATEQPIVRGCRCHGSRDCLFPTTTSPLLCALIFEDCSQLVSSRGLQGLTLSEDHEATFGGTQPPCL